MIVPGMFVCSSFLISVCMFIVSKALLISSATVIVRAGGAIWLNPFATVLFSVCSEWRVSILSKVLNVSTEKSKVMVGSSGWKMIVNSCGVCGKGVRENSAMCT